VPKVFGKEVPPIILVGGVAILAVLVYGQIFPADAAPTGPARKRTTKKSTSKAGTQYTKEDYEAKFAVYNQPVRNSFQPLVVKAPPAVPTIPPGTLPGAPNVLAADLTGGEAGWAYTGYAEIDGIRQGLLENGSTGASVFLRAGQRWKNLTVRSITAENMTVTGPAGTNVTIPVGDTTVEQRTAGNVVPPGGVAPGNPGAPLAGPIGGAAANNVPGAAPGTSGVTSTDLQVQPDNSNDGRRRRGRRGRQQEGLQ
jgi:hypothetical protein